MTALATRARALYRPKRSQPGFSGHLFLRCWSSQAPGVRPSQLRLGQAVQIFGANTDVGKTLISAGMCRAALRRQMRVRYVKPLQTGVADIMEGSAPLDESFVTRHSNPFSTEPGQFTASTLFSWRAAVSPHLASELEKHTVPDEVVLAKVEAEINQFLSHEKEGAQNRLFLLETAGGVCSPTSAATLQVDAYRPLRLPVCFVGDGRLGGISSTVSGLDSLTLRGYDVAVLPVIETAKLGNAEYLRDYLAREGRAIPVVPLSGYPPDHLPLDGWYEENEAAFDIILEHIMEFTEKRDRRLNDLGHIAKEKLWWPFTQHKTTRDVQVMDSAFGDYFHFHNRDAQALERSFDGCASWWTQGVGHGNPRLAATAAYAAGRYGHVMFPGIAHEPAVALSEKLLETVGRGWASRVFFSDDGSTAVEVAIKMALHKYLKDRSLPLNTPLVVLAQEGCYHGDTLGVMDVAVPSVFNENQHPWYEPKGVFLAPPRVRVKEGRTFIDLPPDIAKFAEEIGLDERVELQLESKSGLFSSDRDRSTLAEAYRKHVSAVLREEKGRVGALLIEPVLMGAGGMIFVDPLFQRVLCRECKAQGIPVVLDEVFSGLWRLGALSGASLLGVQPDVASYAKLLTGGLLPLAVTLATEGTFESFLGETKAEAFLHGHSYTAAPVGCAVAVEALQMYTKAENYGRDDREVEEPRMGDFWPEEEVTALSFLPSLESCFSLGTVLVMELKSSDSGYSSAAASSIVSSLLSEGIYCRPLGNVLYVMCSPLTKTGDCRRILDIIRRYL